MFKSTSKEIKKLEMSLFDEGIEDFTGWEEGAYWVRVFDRIIDRVGDMTKDMEGKVFIDLGCGKSMYIPLAWFNGMETVALDISLDFLNLNEDCHKIWADGENIPLRDGCVHFSTSVGMIHHLPNKEDGIREIKRITRDKIFIIEPHSRSMNWIYWAIRRVLIRILGQERLMKLLGFGTPHESFVSRSQLVSVLNPSFDCDVYYFSPFREPPLKFLRERVDFGWLNNILERIPVVKSFGTYIVVEATSNDIDH